MTTLHLFPRRPSTLPTLTVWLLEKLAEARGRQGLFTRQAPQRLKALREHALIESAVSSNRIEGVEIPPARLKAVLFGRPLLKNMYRGGRVECLGRGRGVLWQRKERAPGRDKEGNVSKRG